VVGIAVEQAAFEDVPTAAPPDAGADVFAAWVAVLAPSPGNCTAFWGSMNAGALIAPAVVPVVRWPEVGSGEVGTINGSDAEALEDVSIDEDGVAESDDIPDEVFGVAGGNGASVVGPTPACWVGCPTCGRVCESELVWACAAPKLPRHITSAKINVRRMAFLQSPKAREKRRICMHSRIG
jgi:hypothetical protein